jgi:O-antigen ligase
LTNNPYNESILDKVFNYLILLYAFVIPISRAGIVVLTALLFLLWFFKKDFKQDVQLLRQNKFVLTFFAFVGFSALSLLWTTNYDEGLNYLIRYWYYLPILVIATTLQKKYIEYAIFVFLMGMLISEALSFSIFFEWIDWEGASPADPTPFMNRLQYATFLTFTSLLLLNRMFFAKNRALQVFFFVYFLVVTANLFINGGRTGHIAFFITIFVVGFLNIDNKIKAFILMSILSITIFAVAYNTSPVFKTRYDASINESKKIVQSQFCTSIGQRIGLAIVGKDIFLDYPLFGTGIGDEMDVLKMYVKDEQDFKCLEKRRHFHNAFLHLSVQLGIIGLILFILLFYYLLQIKIDDKKYDNLKIIFVSLYFLSNLTGNMFHQQFTMALLAFFIGLLLSFEVRKEKGLIN